MKHAFELEGQEYPPKGGLMKAGSKGANDIRIPTTRSSQGDPGEIRPELQGALYTTNYAGIAIPAPRCRDYFLLFITANFLTMFLGRPSYYLNN